MTKEINLTQGKVTLVDDSDYDFLSRWKWYYNDGYAERHARVDGKSKHIRMHRVILYAGDGLEVDHINRDKLDNRRSNLRVCNRSQNEFNRNVFPNNTSGVKGISWDKKNKKWRAYIIVNYRFIHVGRYPTIEEASNRLNQKAKELFGAFAYSEAI